MLADKFEFWTRALGHIGHAGESARVGFNPEVCPLPPASALVPAPHTARLTVREFEVALLASQGLRNRDIALNLVISERTVHAHIRSILNKLGVESRVQIASWLTVHERTTPNHK